MSVQAILDQLWKHVLVRMTVGWRFVIHVKVLLKLDVFLLQVEHVPEAGGVVVQLELDQRVQVVEAHVLGLHDGGDGVQLRVGAQAHAQAQAHVRVTTAALVVTAPLLQVNLFHFLKVIMTIFFRLRAFQFLHK